MTTTQDIMKLAYALARSYMSLQEAETFLALESAVKALVAERDALLAENDKLSDLWSVMKAERDALQAKLDDAGRQEPPQNHIYCVFDKTYRLHFWSRAEADKVRSQFSCSTMPFLERIDLLDAHPAPQAAAPQPLTDAQIIEWVESGEYNVRTNDWASHIEFARAVEAAHGIGAKP